MSLQDKIRLFIPPVYYKVKKRLLKKKQQEYNPLPMVKHEHKGMVVVGNGPSLNKTMELYSKQLRDYDCLMVNFSARTPLFEQIQPRYYVMVDSEWINAKSEIMDSIMSCVEAIVTKTHWPMYIIMPAAFKGWGALNEFAKNPNLTLLFDESAWRKYPEVELFPAFAENRISPPTCTVLTYGVYLSLYWDYEETYLVGADTTFTAMIYVGQKDNVLYTVDTHFYNNDEVCPEPTDPEFKGRPYGMDMEHYLAMCHSIFYEYGLMARYAEWKGLKVYNASEYSMIDCLERKKLA